MWIATTRGFFSAVQHRDDASLLVVRTRHHADALALESWYAQWLTDMDALDAPPAVRKGLPVPAIVSYERSDYPWRVILPRTAWAAFLAESVEDLDYGNFKAAVADRQGPEREHVYHAVWAALLRLEDLDPMGRAPEPMPDDEAWAEYDDWATRDTQEDPEGTTWAKDADGDWQPVFP